MMLSVVGMTSQLKADTFPNFYEVITDGEAPFQNCTSGELSEFIKSVEQRLKPKYLNSTFGFICVPKWYIVGDPEKKKVVLVPYSLGNEIDPNSIRIDIRLEIERAFPLCSDGMQTCIENSFEKLAYQYDGSASFPNFTSDSYDYESFLDELMSPDLENVIRIQILKLIQANLTPEDYIPNKWVDGAVGPGTKEVLKQFFDDFKTQYPGAVPRDVLFTKMFKTLVSSEDTPPYTPNTLSDAETAVATGTETVQASDTTQVDNSIDEKSPKENLANVDETAVTTEPVKLDQASVDEANQSNQFEVTIQDLRKKLEEQQHLYEELLESYEALEATQEVNKKALKELLEQPISQIWDSKLAQGTFEIRGIMPNGEPVDLNIIERKFSDMFCNVKINQSLDKQFVEHLTQTRCFEVKLEEFDEDKINSRNFDTANNVLSIPVLEKQRNTIASIKSEKLANFSPDDINFCWVGLKVIDEKNSDLETTVQIYLEDIEHEGENIVILNNAVILDDFKFVGEKAIPWRNRLFQLIDLTPEGETTNCTITDTKPFEILESGTAPNDLAQVAVIDRSGHIMLKNLQLVKKKEPELHVFLDTLVGFEGDQNYGFNKAILDPKMQRTQRIYFEGFLLGLQSYLSTNESIQKVTVHQTILDENGNRDLSPVHTFTRDKALTDNEIINNEFISTYMQTFEEGISGEFDNKRSYFDKLLKLNGNSRFVTFGSSGFNVDQVCSVPKARLDYNQSALIFDIVPRNTIINLSENDTIDEIEQSFAFRCKEYNEILLIRPLSAMTSEDVSNMVVSQLAARRF